MPDTPAEDKSLSPKRRRLLAALAANWQTEMSGYYTYRTLAERDSDPIRRQTLQHMAEAEAEHAAAWAGRIEDLGGEIPRYRGKLTGDADTLANRLGGQRMALRRLEIDESRAIAAYGQQIKELDDQLSLVILRRVIEEEREHYCQLSDLIRDRYPRRPQAAGATAHGDGVSAAHDAAASMHQDAGASTPQALLADLLSKRSGAARPAAGWIGDAIYGVNDGLGAIFGIVSGVSGATVGNSKYVLLAGIAGMIASALSMGSGAWLAARSEREIYQAEVARERDAIEMNAPESRELLSLYYQVKGLPEDDADHVVQHIAKDKDQFLRALASERLNSTEDALRNPTTSALSSAASTAIGAFVPIIPFFFLRGYEAIFVSAIVSLAAHFAVGAAKSLITVRSWWASGLEMTLVGAVEGIVTYIIGIGLGRVGA